MKYLVKSGSIVEGERELPVRATADVIVAGGGTAGIAAAVAAARNGARTILVEELSYLGGTMSGALVCQTTGCAPAIGAVFNELLERMEAKREAFRIPDVTAFWDVEACKDAAADMLEDEGAELLLYTRVSDPVVVDGKVAGVVIESAAGREALLGAVVVDCSGDADVAFRAGAPCVLGRERDAKMRPINVLSRFGNVDVDRLVDHVAANPGNFNVDPKQHVIVRGRNIYRIVGFFEETKKAKLSGEIHPECHYIRLEVIFPEKGIVTLNSSRVYGVDATDPASLTRATLESRRQTHELAAFLKKYIPGFEHAFLMDFASMPGIRETRRIIGEYVLTSEDIAGDRPFPDSIARNVMRMKPGEETHSPDGNEGNEGHVIYRTLERAKFAHNIPYRCLVPQKVDGLLAAGRIISVTHSADDWTRNIPPAMLCGQAAGTAAAMASQSGVQPRRIDVSLLQKRLREQGVDIGDVG